MDLDLDLDLINQLINCVVCLLAGSIVHLLIYLPTCSLPFLAGPYRSGIKKERKKGKKEIDSRNA